MKPGTHALFAIVSGAVAVAATVGLAVNATVATQRAVSFGVVSALGFAAWTWLRKHRSPAFRQIAWWALAVVAVALVAWAGSSVWRDREDSLFATWLGSVVITWLCGSCLLDEERSVPFTLLRLGIGAFVATEGLSYFQRFVLEQHVFGIAGRRPELAWVVLVAVALLLVRLCGRVQRRPIALGLFTVAMLGVWRLAEASFSQPWVSFELDPRVTGLVLPAMWWWGAQWLFSARGQALPLERVGGSSLAAVGAASLSLLLGLSALVGRDPIHPAWASLPVVLVVCWALLASLTARRDDVGTWRWSVDFGLSVLGVLWLVAAVLRPDDSTAETLPMALHTYGLRPLADVVVPSAIAVWFAGVALKSRTSLSMRVGLAFVAALLARFGSQALFAAVSGASFARLAEYPVVSAPYVSTHADIALGVLPCWLVLPMLARVIVVRLRGVHGLAVWALCSIALTTGVALAVRQSEHTVVQNLSWTILWLVPALWWVGAQQLSGRRALELQASAAVNVSSSPEPSVFTSA